MHARTTAVAVAVLAVVSLTVPLAGPAAAAAPPPNDDRAGAVPIRSVPFHHEVETAEATRSPDDPTACGSLGHTVWYTLRLATSQWVQIDTWGSGYNTEVGVFTRSGGAFTKVACGHDNFSPSAWFSFPAKAGTTYYVMVGACCGETGRDLVLDVATAPRQLRAEITVDDGVVDPGGVVTILATVRCTVPAPMELWYEVRQDRLGGEAVWSDETVIGCTPEGFRWSETMSSATSVPFARGPAEVHLDWFVTNYLTGDYGVEDTHVRLRPTAAP